MKKTKPMAVQIVQPQPKYSGKGTKARLNTAASKTFFRGNSKTMRSNS